MASLSDWKVSPSVQPKAENYRFDLERALSTVVGLHTIIYLITEAQNVWINLIDGRPVQGHVLGYDQATGFGLVQALARLDMPHLLLGDSGAAEVGDPV